MSLSNEQTYAFEQKELISSPIPVTSHLQQQGIFDIDPDMNSSWLHSIMKINRQDRTITLENGSVWKLGMLYFRIFDKWQEGDQVTLSWYQDTYFLDTQIKNYTKQSYAWSNMKLGPQPEASGFLSISKVIPQQICIELSNGVKVKTKYPWMFRNFREGDIVMTLYGKGIGSETLYSLWDLTSGYIAYDLSIA